MLGFGQRENTFEREVDDLGHPFLLLLVGRPHPDRGPEQTSLRRVPSSQGSVSAGEFEDPEAVEDPPRWGIDGEIGWFHQVEVDQRLRELFREFAALPVFGQQRFRFGLQEGPQAGPAPGALRY